MPCKSAKLPGWGSPSLHTREVSRFEPPAVPFLTIVGGDPRRVRVRVLTASPDEAANIAPTLRRILEDVHLRQSDAAGDLLFERVPEQAAAALPSGRGASA